ncbi:phage GP46 family protein [Roseospira navarrensis]|uniref:phage GP46 family protein n=1 Tax=Roseospira navarrensis TaxID=140058 RepID=UPI001B8652C5|nr:phage GP46 family protein [Roseospira navarrensis]
MGLTDAALIWDAEAGAADLALGPDGDLVADDGLRTAVIVSLFSDRRARPDDTMPDQRPDADQDRRGWWGDALPPTIGGRVFIGDRIGSRLWLLQREKITPETLARHRDAIREALAWMTDAAVGLARSVDVQVERQGLNRVAARITITLHDGSTVPIDLAAATAPPARAMVVSPPVALATEDGRILTTEDGRVLAVAIEGGAPLAAATVRPALTAEDARRLAAEDGRLLTTE